MEKRNVLSQISKSKIIRLITTINNTSKLWFVVYSIVVIKTNHIIQKHFCNFRLNKPLFFKHFLDNFEKNNTIHFPTLNQHSLTKNGCSKFRFSQRRLDKNWRKFF